MTPARAALDEASGRLRDAGIAEPRGDAQLLLCASLSIAREALIAAPGRCLDAGETEGYRALVDRRCAREPVSRILGKREFWSLEFGLCPATLDPRPDSETVIEAVLAWQPDREAALRILDLGTGSGCLLLALLGEYPNARGVGTDCAPAAASQAYQNAAKLGFARRARFVCTDWDQALAPGRYSLIISNPPYIPQAAIDKLAPEVANFEPRAALDGGADGLQAYRTLGPILGRRLALGGAIFVEIGAGQADRVSAVMAEFGLDRFVHSADLSGKLRCLGLHKFKSLATA